LLGAKQTRDLESMGVMVLWFGGIMVTSQGIKNEDRMPKRYGDGIS